VEGITHDERLSDTAIRGVYPEYGEMRNEIPMEAAGSLPKDIAERRRVAFLGAILRRKLFSGTPAIGETVRIDGVKFTVVGSMDTKFSDSNYFTSDRRIRVYSVHHAGELWDARYASVMLFRADCAEFEADAMQQFRAAIANRQHFSPSDKRAITMFGREEFKPIYEGITLGIEALLFFVGALTLGIGRRGRDEYHARLRRRTRPRNRPAPGARCEKITHSLQFLLEALVMTLAAGVIGMLLSTAITSAIGTLPFLGPAYEDDSGKVDIHLTLSFVT